MTPLHFRAVPAEDHFDIEAYDAAGLFDRARKYQRSNDCQRATSIYHRLVAEFPTSTLAAPSLYNSGLCNTAMKAYRLAAEDYTRIATAYPESEDATAALFQAAEAYEKLEDWDAALAAFDLILTERADVSDIERVEALARKGSALMALDKQRQANTTLNTAVLVFRTGKGIPATASTYYYAMASFKLAEIIHGEMQAVTLPGEEALIKPALEQKCQLLIDAQAAYTKTIRVAHPHWAAAAAFRIGDLYLNLWEDMVAAPPPADLEREAREVYAEVLKDRIRVLLKKAIFQWERTLKMARRLNLSNQWVEQTTQSLKEIRERLAIDVTNTATE
ncbi:MAG: tetratricopeptide repeat protein [Myxococcota bacterium]|nr:tetratricopeptide repeat protein [Myxococcota bacterium]